MADGLAVGFDDDFDNDFESDFESDIDLSTSIALLMLLAFGTCALVLTDYTCLASFQAELRTRLVNSNGRRTPP